MKWTSTWSNSWRDDKWQDDKWHSNDWRGEPSAPAPVQIPARSSVTEEPGPVPRLVKRRRLEGPQQPVEPPPQAVQQAFSEESVPPMPGTEERIAWILELRNWLRHNFSMAEFDVLMSREV